MNLLSPLTALLAAAVTIPLLLLLYVLKLRRRFVRVGSTMLWEKAYEDLEVNTPFQKLRWSLLLLVQLLLLITLLLAMARPVMESDGSFSSRVVLLIDRSASMQATIAEGRSRLDEAKREARMLVERLGRSDVRQVMVIAFARTAEVVSGFQFDRRTLLRAIESIEPTDEVADLDAALQLASAFGGESIAESEQADAPAVDVVLFSDGNVGPPPDEAGFRIRGGSFRFVPIPADAEATKREIGNVGIVSFSARRDYDDPLQLTVFARLISTARTPTEIVLTLRADGEPVEIRRAVIPAAEDGDGAESTRLTPGELSVSMSMTLETGAALSLHHNHDDLLDSDDTAWLVMPPPRRPRIALVHPDDGADPFAVELLENLEPSALERMTLEAFSEIDPRQLDSGELFDLVVFDRVNPPRLPGVSTLTLGGAPAGLDTQPPADDRGRRILSWDRQHPIMRHVALDTIVYRGFGAYELPAGATALARGPEGPVIALVGARGARHVVVGFPLDPGSTNWPLHVSSVVFMQNVADFLTLTATGEVGLVFQPGDPISVRAAADAEVIAIEGPFPERIETEPGAMRTLPSLRRVGLYSVQGVTPPMDRIAVSLLSDQESDPRPVESITVNARRRAATAGGLPGVRELWPWLAALAIVLLIAEWLLYCRRAS